MNLVTFCFPATIDVKRNIFDLCTDTKDCYLAVIEVKGASCFVLIFRIISGYTTGILSDLRYVLKLMHFQRWLLLTYSFDWEIYIVREIIRKSQYKTTWTVISWIPPFLEESASLPEQDRFIPRMVVSFACTPCSGISLLILLPFPFRVPGITFAEFKNFGY